MKKLGFVVFFLFSFAFYPRKNEIHLRPFLPLAMSSDLPVEIEKAPVKVKKDKTYCKIKDLRLYPSISIPESNRRRTKPKRSDSLFTSSFRSNASPFEKSD